jgi:hypothetical protein
VFDWEWINVEITTQDEEVPRWDYVLELHPVIPGNFPRSIAFVARRLWRYNIAVRMESATTNSIADEITYFQSVDSGSENGAEAEAWNDEVRAGWGKRCELGD